MNCSVTSVISKFALIEQRHAGWPIVGYEDFRDATISRPEAWRGYLPTTSRTGYHCGIQPLNEAQEHRILFGVN